MIDVTNSITSIGGVAIGSTTESESIAGDHETFDRLRQLFLREDDIDAGASYLNHDLASMPASLMPVFLQIRIDASKPLEEFAHLFPAQSQRDGSYFQMHVTAYLTDECLADRRLCQNSDDHVDSGIRLLVVSYSDAVLIWTKSK